MNEKLFPRFSYDDREPFFPPLSKRKTYMLSKLWDAVFPDLGEGEGKKSQRVALKNPERFYFSNFFLAYSITGASQGRGKKALSSQFLRLCSELKWKYYFNDSLPSRALR